MAFVQGQAVVPLQRLTLAFSSQQSTTAVWRVEINSDDVPELGFELSSHDNLKIRVRCGLMSLADQTRCTVALDTPTCLAIERVLHRPVPPGGLTASLKILPLSDGLIRSGRPLRANSAKPPIPSRRKRLAKR